MNPASPCLMQLLVEKVGTLRPTKAEAASFEAILTTPDNCGKDVGAALAWARSSKEFAHLLPEKNGHVVQLLSIPLLMWGLRQPWADTISASHVVNFWFKYQARTAPIEDKALDQAWATRAIRSIALDPLATRARAEDCCREWFYHCDRESELWKNWQSINVHNLNQIYEAWLDMARIALPDLRNLERPKETLQKEWLLRMAFVFKNMPVAQQSDVLLTMLTSELHDAVKLTVAKKATALSWVNPSVHTLLRPLLPPADHACYPQLPWTEPKSHLRDEDVVYANETIARVYCPTLALGFELMLRAEDWLHRETVCRVAEQNRPGKKPAAMLPIGDLVI